MYGNSTLNILEKGHAWAAKHCLYTPFKMDSIQLKYLEFNPQ